MQFSAADQRHGHASLGNIEAEGTDDQVLVLGGDVEFRVKPMHQVGPAAMKDGGSLGLARGSGSENHINQRVRSRLAGRKVLAFRVNQRPITIQIDYGSLVLRYAFSIFLMGQ